MKLKVIKYVAILICLSMIMISVANAEDYIIINLDSVEDICARIYFIPPLETALARLNEDSDSLHG